MERPLEREPLDVLARLGERGLFIFRFHWPGRPQPRLLNRSQVLAIVWLTMRHHEQLRWIAWEDREGLAAYLGVTTHAATQVLRQLLSVGVLVEHPSGGYSLNPDWQPPAGDETPP